DIFKQLLIRWIYVTNTAFYAVEDPTFHILLHNLLSCASRPNGLRNTLPKSSTTITNWIMLLYRDSSIAVRNYFKVLPFRIHLSFDLWSSPNH
ncbi:hypothetical protein L873DRAFT_1700097, partial [Choiromyces venosus 120613-1]